MSRRGFTFIEVMVVLGIILLLMSLLLPAVHKVRQAAARTQTNNNLKQSTLALHNCDSAYKKFPPAVGPFGQIGFKGNTAGYSPTLFYHLLPFIEEDNLYKNGTDAKGKPMNPANIVANAKTDLTKVVVLPYVSPQDPSQLNKGAGASNMAANLRVFSDVGFQVQVATAGIPKANTAYPGVYPYGKVLPYGQVPYFYGTPSLSHSFPDGTSNTLTFATTYMVCPAEQNFFLNPPRAGTPSPFFAYYGVSKPCNSNKGGKSCTGSGGCIFQVQPKQMSCDPSIPQSLSVRGISVGRCDGGVTMIAPSISVATWAALVQPNDGIPPGADFEP